MQGASPGPAASCVPRGSLSSGALRTRSPLTRTSVLDAIRDCFEKCTLLMAPLVKCDQLRQLTSAWERPFRRYCGRSRLLWGQLPDGAGVPPGPSHPRHMPLPGLPLSLVTANSVPSTSALGFLITCLCQKPSELFNSFGNHGFDDFQT